jgi:hypothetical protein
MRWLVEGMMPAGAATLLASDGSVGKSYLSLQLGLAVAGAFGPEPPPWLGQRIVPADGLVYIVSAEDDQDEVERRLHALATPEQLAACADRLMILCLPNEGGAKPLVSHARRRIGDELVEINRPAAWWRETVDAIKARAQKVALFVVDTYSATSHGDDRSGQIAREYMEQASIVCGELGATLQINMHFRKSDDRGFENADQALVAIKGSNAMPNAVRSAIVIYKFHRWRDDMRALGRKVEPNQCYRVAVPKSNRVGAPPERVVLRNRDTGLLEAVDIPDTEHRLCCAMAISVREAVLHFVPLTKRGQPSVEDHPERLHPDLRRISRNRLHAIVDRCLELEMIVRAPLHDGHQQREYLDVPGGPIAAGHIGRDDLARSFVKYGFDRWRHWNEEAIAYGEGEGIRFGAGRDDLDDHA